MVWIHHKLFVYSSTDGLKGCFHFSAIMNSTVMNLSVHMSLISILLGIYLEVELLNHLIILCLIFVRNCQPVFHRGCLLAFRQQCTRVPVSLYPHPHIIFYFCLFYNKRDFNGCEVVFHCDFDLHFSNNSLY